MDGMSYFSKAIRNPRTAVKFFLGWVDGRINFGTNIFDHDWDTLIVLDACRYDLFKTFAPRHDVYEDFSAISSIRSIASMTPIWLQRTFENAPAGLVSSTHYVSGAGQSERCLGDFDLHQIDHVWKYAMDPETGQTRPEAITDAAIDAIHSSSADRIVVHYPDPHAPFLHCIGKYESRGIEQGDTQNIWTGLKEGRFDKDEIWTDYGQNLLRILDEVETIVQDVEGDIVITSDHGNAMGEWGVYGHPAHVPIAVIRQVPWVKTQGKGNHTYTIKGKKSMTTESSEPSLEEHLRALGYKT